jgi:hypothetical protein
MITTADRFQPYEADFGPGVVIMARRRPCSRSIRFGLGRRRRRACAVQRRCSGAQAGRDSRARRARLAWSRGATRGVPGRNSAGTVRAARQDVRVAERVLSWGELNRALLARQLLLERAELAPVKAVERVGGLQTQYAPSGYVGLWSRLAGFRRADLTAALTAGTIVQGWVMRCTIHMVSAADYAPLTEAVREPRRTWMRRAYKELPELEMDAVADTVRGYLAAGPLRQAEIVGRLQADGHPKVAWQGVQLWLDLVRVPPAGTWELPRAHVYGLAAGRLTRPAALEPAQELLVTRYLRGFGPASAKDVSRYAGWTIGEARAVLQRMTLRRFRDPDGGELLDLSRAPIPAADTPAPVRFLSTFDAALLLGHATRARILPAEHREKVFHTRMPQSVPTFLVDGRVAGTWRYTDGRVVPEPFEDLPGPARREVDEEAGRLTAFYDA